MPTLEPTFLSLSFWKGEWGCGPSPEKATMSTDSRRAPRGAVPRLGRWQESVLNPIPGRERPFVSYRVHCRCAFLMQALLLLLWLIYLILGSTPLGGRGHHGSFREQETNITTSSGWLAPGSFKAPCQPPPVALTSSPPPSRSRLLWFQAAVEPQKLYHQCLSSMKIAPHRILDTTNLKAMIPCEQPPAWAHGKQFTVCQSLSRERRAAPYVAVGSCLRHGVAKHSHLRPLIKACICKCPCDQCLWLYRAKGP